MSDLEKFKKSIDSRSRSIYFDINTNCADYKVHDIVSKYFRSYYHGYRVHNRKLILQFSKSVYNYIMKIKTMEELIKLLMNYLNDEGLKFFYNSFKTRKERVMEGIHCKMLNATEQRREYYYRCIQKQDMRNIKDTSIKTHCRIGNV